MDSVCHLKIHFQLLFPINNAVLRGPAAIKLRHAMHVVRPSVSPSVPLWLEGHRTG